MKICTCESCRYTFRYPPRAQRANGLTQSPCPASCPDCGKKTIRMASSKEIAWFYKTQAILAEEIRTGLYAATG